MPCGRMGKGGVLDISRHEEWLHGEGWWSGVKAMKWWGVVKWGKEVVRCSEVMKMRGVVRWWKCEVRWGEVWDCKQNTPATTPYHRGSRNTFLHTFTTPKVCRYSRVESRALKFHPPPLPDLPIQYYTLPLFCWGWGKLIIYRDERKTN